MKKDKKNSEIGLVLQRISGRERLLPWGEFLKQESLLPHDRDENTWFQERSQLALHYFIVKKPKAKEGFEQEGGMVAFATLSAGEAQRAVKDELLRWGQSVDFDVTEPCMLVLNLHSKAGFKQALKTLVNNATMVAKAAAPEGIAPQFSLVFVPTSDASVARSLKSLGFENVFTSEKIQIYRISNQAAKSPDSRDLDNSSPAKAVF